MSAKLNLVGFRTHRLTVVSEAEPLPSRARSRWLCQCDCGKQVTVFGYNLSNGHTKSCGCLKVDELVERVTTHGLSRLHRKEYKAWKAIRDRCSNPNASNYHLYGARGITVSPVWDDFSKFLQDMGECPSSAHSIDRIDNEGPYAPGNCRWATKTEQANNRRSNRTVEAFGETLTLAQAVRKYAEPCGVNYSTVQARIHYGWPVERALTQKT